MLCTATDLPWAVKIGPRGVNIFVQPPISSLSTASVGSMSTRESFRHTSLRPRLCIKQGFGSNRSPSVHCTGLTSVREQTMLLSPRTTTWKKCRRPIAQVYPWLEVDYSTTKRGANTNTDPDTRNESFHISTRIAHVSEAARHPCTGRRYLSTRVRSNFWAQLLHSEAERVTRPKRARKCDSLSLS
ncbi:unnamed protein product [Ectocarpus sp. 12 AP-2014]